MKVLCTKENLQAGLGMVSRVSTKNLTLPILGNVLIRAESGGLFLSATNLEVGVVVRVRAKVTKEGALTVQGRLIADFVGLLENDKVELTGDGSSLRIVGESSETTIRGIPADDFPIIPTVPRVRRVQVEADAFRLALNQVLFAAAQDSSRPEISGVFLSINGQQLTLAATDSYRLAERTLKIESPGIEHTTIIPNRALFELSRILPGEGQVEIFFGDSQVLFVTDSVELTTRLIEGQYPDYKQIIPDSAATQVTAEVEALAKLVKTASLFCKPGINDVTLILSSDKKSLSCSSANTELGEHHGVLKADVSGKENTIVFNYRYFLDGLVNIGATRVQLGVIDSSSPGVLRPEGQTEYLYLLMPIRQ
ncbi:MAG: DNA polymerase III subunit beta [Candidatus Kerfeldbacteria bacterium]|nr:DNA polymerase III subunit beta [Candidatus Kerfeldbacteria bacterium]